jgi:hypothetical protein
VKAELPVVGAIVHDMAGMLSNVSAFAGILEQRPDHPSRAEFLPIMAKEARSATEALKDLQLARTLSDRWPPEHLFLVPLERPLRAAAEEVGDRAWLDSVLSDVPEGTSVRCDEGILIGLLTRSLAVASQGDTGRPAPLTLVARDDEVSITLDVTHAAYDGDIGADIERGRRELRPIALLRGVIEAWGGSSQIVVTEDASIHVICKFIA